MALSTLAHSLRSKSSMQKLTSILLFLSLVTLQQPSFCLYFLLPVTWTFKWRVPYSFLTALSHLRLVVINDLKTYISFLLECDPRCKTCSGPGHRSCLTCHKRATLHPRKTGAECLTKCHRRHYLALDNTCRSKYVDARQWVKQTIYQYKNTQKYLEVARCFGKMV